MIWLYLYLTGYIITTFGLFVHLKYEKEMDRYSSIGGEDIATKACQGLAWPFVLLYLGASQCASRLHTRKLEQIKKQKEKKELLKKHQELLKEHGISF